MSLDKIENASPARLELVKAVSTLKRAETLYEESTKSESAAYTDKTTELAKKLSLLMEKKATLKAQIAEKERKIEQLVKATHAESDAKVLNDLEESRIRAVEAQKRELMLKDKLEKTSRMLEQIKYDRASKKLIAEEKEQYNAAVMKAAIKYTGLELVIVTEDTIKFEYKYINKLNPEQIYSFTLYLAEDSTYKLIECKPPLPTIKAHFDKINADRDLYGFIKAIRKDFVEYFQ